MLLHELGVHYGLKNLLGAERFKGVTAELKRLLRAGDADVLAAYRSVPNDTPRAFVDDRLLDRAQPGAAVG